MTEPHSLPASNASTASQRGLFSRLGQRLFEPSPLITDAVERRRARMLPKLQLAHAAQMLSGIITISLVETEEVRRTMPKVLGVACTCILICYALSRTRHVLWSIWGYIGVTVATSSVGLLVSAPKSGNLPLMCIIFLLPPVVFTNALISARAALVTGGVALVPMLGVVAWIGTPAWGDSVRAGIEFYVTLVVLTVIFGVYRDGIEAQRVRELRARNQELEDMRRTLDDQVTARTRELSERNAAMRLVLDNVSQGILIVSRSGAIFPEHSATLSKWFGDAEPGEPFFRYLGRHSPSVAERIEVGWEQVVDDMLPLELALEQVPSQLETGQRTYRLSYEPIESDTTGRLLIVVSDVTAEGERTRAELEKKENFLVFERLLADRRGFISFMHEASELVARVLDPDCERSELNRALHTLKGNAMLFGIQSIASACHDLESSLEQGGAPNPAQLTTISERWRRLSADADALIGQRENSIELTLEQHAALARMAWGNEPREELARRIDELALESVERRLVNLADHARRLAERFEKRVEVEIAHDGTLLDGRPWSQLWPALVHTVRNALDHGIELPEERSARGKPEAGRMALRARREGTSIVLEIEDDGRGIDWEAIRRRCQAMKLPAATRADLLEGLFADGMSTAQQVTDISGRGIGMGAFRAAVQALGGSLVVRSEPGAGTLLQMRFAPLPASGVPLPRLAVASDLARSSESQRPGALN